MSMRGTAHSLPPTQHTHTQFVGLDAQEGLNMKEFHALLSSKTKLVALPHVSNTLGCVNPVKEIVAAAHDVDAVVLVDACQSVPHMKVRVSAFAVGGPSPHPLFMDRCLPS